MLTLARNRLHDHPAIAPVTIAARAAWSQRPMPYEAEA